MYICLIALHYLFFGVTLNFLLFSLMLTSWKSNVNFVPFLLCFFFHLSSLKYVLDTNTVCWTNVIQNQESLSSSVQVEKGSEKKVYLFYVYQFFLFFVFCLYYLSFYSYFSVGAILFLGTTIVMLLLGRLLRLLSLLVFYALSPCLLVLIC